MKKSIFMNISFLLVIILLFSVGSLYAQDQTTAKEKTAVIKVTGLACASCAKRVENSLKEDESVTSVTVDGKDGTATITYKNNKPDLEALAKKVTKDTGFKAEVSDKKSKKKVAPKE